ncbi:YbeD family protein [Legionella sp. W05-934-2]|jgi:putative lipoic acid-binding regulatory protein|uniref:HP0495 family protein n=1 Tax=Legionella sp. W05-934-2 TaxID=1198649 RepID=UPI0034623785
MANKHTMMDFPTDFKIKVFGPNDHQYIEEIRQLSHDHCEQGDKPTFTYQPSTNHRYISITIAFHVTSKSNLDKIYNALTAHPQVKMVI